MNFTNKETYLAAVVEWKAEYNALSQEIRDTRKLFNDAQKAFAKSSTKDNTYWPAWKEVERLRDLRSGLVYTATTLLAERHAGKEEAQEQYKKEHAAK